MTDRARPERIFAHHHDKSDPGYPFEGWWHCDDGAAGQGMSPAGYVDGEQYDALKARAEKLEKRLADCVVWMETREKMVPGMPRICDMARALLSMEEKA